VGTLPARAPPPPLDCAESLLYTRKALSYPIVGEFKPRDGGSRSFGCASDLRFLGDLSIYPAPWEKLHTPCIWLTPTPGVARTPIFPTPYHDPCQIIELLTIVTKRAKVVGDAQRRTKTRVSSLLERSTKGCYRYRRLNNTLTRSEGLTYFDIIYYWLILNIIVIN